MFSLYRSNYQRFPSQVHTEIPFSMDLDFALDHVSIALFQYFILPLSGVCCKMLKNTEGAITNGQSRETGNLEYTNHRTKTSNYTTTKSNKQTQTKTKTKQSKQNPLRIQHYTEN